MRNSSGIPKKSIKFADMQEKECINDSIVTIARTLALVVASLVITASCLAYENAVVVEGRQPRDYAVLQRELNGLVEGKDARIGIAVIIDDKDTIGINQCDTFPMLSVYKFPIALSWGKYCRMGGCDLDSKCRITRSDLLYNTYSPMLKNYSDIDTVMISFRELLAYSLQQSDNNASDIILKCQGGPQYVQRTIDSMGISGICVTSSEAEMYQDNALCYDNSATPLAMAELLNKFDNEFADSVSLGIKQLMESCETGADRLVSPLVHTNAVVGHKTGTGFTLPDGRLMAVNDVGYVHLPDGRKYTIVVFVSNSNYDMATTSGIIANISELVYHFMN